MRLKVIAGNVVVVLLVGLGAFYFARTELRDAIRHDVEMRSEKDGAVFTRLWRLSAFAFLEQTMNRAQTVDVRDSVLAIGEKSQRLRAHEASNKVARWFRDPSRRGASPSIVAVVDEVGRVVARDRDNNRLFGKSLIDDVPAVATAVQDGSASVGIWRRSDEGDYLQVAVAPIRDAQRKMIGALLVGYDISSEFAKNQSALLGREVAIFFGEKVYASSLSASLTSEFDRKINEKELANNLVASGAQEIQLAQKNYRASFGRLPLTDDQQCAFAVLENESNDLEKLAILNLILILTAIGVIGVIAYGFVVAGSFLRPLEKIEQGVLGVINGNLGLRLDVKSAEFGGLAYRINQLLNIFASVDDSGEQGEKWSASMIADRPAISGPKKTADGAIDDPELAEELMNESEDVYLQRVYDEYVQAKEAIGEDISNIPAERFIERLRKNGEVQAKKHGCKAVRFVVDVKGTRVNMIPVLIR